VDKEPYPASQAASWNVGDNLIVVITTHACLTWVGSGAAHIRGTKVELTVIRAVSWSQDRIHQHTPGVSVYELTDLHFAILRWDILAID